MEFHARVKLYPGLGSRSCTCLNWLCLSDGKLGYCGSTNKISVQQIETQNLQEVYKSGNMHRTPENLQSSKKF